jgi:hypothetical protein
MKSIFIEVFVSLKKNRNKFDNHNEEMLTNENKEKNKI